jgi:hypothetical protein
LIKWLKNNRATRFAKGTLQYLIPPSVEHEKTFLHYQVKLRHGRHKLLNEAMLVLDIIDAKTQALLAYISISFVAVVFLLTLVRGHKTITELLLIVIILLLIAIVICLTCLNIVGAHTVKRGLREDEYEALIVKVTLGRRMRYLIAHRISVLTAILLIVVFLYLLLTRTSLFSGTPL